MSQMYHEVSRIPLEERKKIKGLSKQRADILLAGIATIKALFDIVLGDKIIVSRSGLRDGIFYEYLFADAPDPLVDSVLEHSLENFQKLFKVHNEISSIVSNAALYLFDSLQTVHGLSEYERRILSVTARVESCGCYINTEKWTKHSAYLVLSSHLHGLKHAELSDVASLLLGKGDRKLKKLLILIRLAKLAVLQVGIEQQELFCRLEGERVVIGSAPGMRHTVMHSADTELDIEIFWQTA